MKMDFIGKGVLFEHEGERVLAIGDLHLGYSGAMRQSGVLVPATIYEDTIKDLTKIFEQISVSKTRKLSAIVILGDLKHAFGRILKEEWDEVGAFISHASAFCENLILVKGNHDVILDSMLRRSHVRAVDYHVWNGVAFLHGDRDFPEIHDTQITHWIVGHAHPAITLADGTKKEKYKCFLSGKHQKKEVVIVPSFLPVNEGTDVLGEFNLGLAWDFTIDRFEVYVVSDDSLETLRFGTVKRIRQ